MQIPNHQAFLDAIQQRREVEVTWPSKEDGGRMQTRRCAPMDYGPSRRRKDGVNCYHFWDFESDSGSNHVLTLSAAQISSVQVLDSDFDPHAFVTWETRWFVPRSTWGVFN